MTIDVYTATGTKKGTATLPKSLFEASINQGLMHQAVVRSQSNRRQPIAHVKNRGEVRASTRKLYRQKGTGRARRGSVSSPILRGGGKAFGARNNANYEKDMPKKMRRLALFSSLSAQAKQGNIVGLESYPETIKTKDIISLLEKLPVDIGRRILFVLPEKHVSLELSARNVPGVSTIAAQYLNPEDVLTARHIVFLVDAIKKAEEVFGGAVARGAAKQEEEKKEAPKKEKTEKKAAPKAEKKTAVKAEKDETTESQSQSDSDSQS